MFSNGVTYLLIRSDKRVSDLFDMGRLGNVHGRRPTLVSLTAVRKDAA